MTETLKQAEQAAKKAEENVKKATAEAGEKATAMFKDLSGRAREAMDKSSKLAEDVVKFNRANVEALVEAGKIAAKGFETAVRDSVETGRKNYEATTSHVKAVVGAKSPNEFFKMQSDFARSQFDAAVKEVSRASEFYVKLAGDVFQPIQSRYAVAADEVKARFAA